jgi:4,5-DOPA dioxygenase extradiol
MFPALFVSHGSPTLPFDDCRARGFLRGLGGQLPKPSAILAVSAHWDTDAPTLNAVARNDAIHDFYGFPKALYELSYTPPGAPALAERAAALLKQADLLAQIDMTRGLDHGAWVPLMLAYPAADIPVLQLSIQTGRGARHHIDLGRALRPLRDDVLILASGGFVHNLRAIAWNGGPEPDWSRLFADWMDRALTERRDDDLAQYRSRAPEAATAHPTDDHLMPLFVAYGAGEKAQRLHSSTTFGSLRMDAYRFD